MSAIDMLPSIGIAMLGVFVMVLFARSDDEGETEAVR